MKNAFKYIINNEILGWKKWEIIWMLVASVVILVFSLICGEDIIYILAAITGSICVVCTGKGKLSTYIFGIFNNILYGIIAYRALFYGEAILNVFYYFPLQFYGFWVWYRSMNGITHEIDKMRMQQRNRGILILVVVVLAAVCGILLSKAGGYLPYVDGFGVIVSVVAMILSIKMYTEQWLLWILVDAIKLFMWIWLLVNGDGHIAITLMWGFYLGNAIVMYFRWADEIEKADRN